ncbi:MAG TPA: HAD family hydrolase [Opitutaceae bacterium]|nr:HAD family hydrolase [Opitutaceae bacterium]
MAPGVRCVAFDFDGTLVDSNRLKHEAWFAVFGEAGFGRPEIDALLRAHPLADRFELVDRLLATRGEADSVLRAHLVERYNFICEEGQSTCPEIPGASELLRELSARLPLYVNSATPEEPLRRIVARRGWSGHFRAVYGRPRSKVDNLRRIAAEQSVDLARLALVGDGPADAMAAAETGCRFVAVGDWARRESSGGARARSLDEVRDLLCFRPC